MKLRGLLWWVDRWRGSTAYTGMTLEEQGAYRNLLDEAYLRGGAIPNDEGVLSRACGDASVWPRVTPSVMRHFTLKDDGWHNDTLDTVLRYSARNAARQRKFRSKNGESVTASVTSSVTHGVTKGVSLGGSGSGSGSVRTEIRDVSRSRASLIQPRRGDAAFEGPRLYVPQALHAHFVKLRNHPDAEKELQLWYEAISEDWTHGAKRDVSPGGDMFAFWRERFTEKWPPPAKRRSNEPEWMRES